MATANEHRAASVRDDDTLVLEVPGPIPLAVTQSLLMLPLPLNVIRSMPPGSPQAVPAVVDVCWDCATGMKTVTSKLAIGPGVIPA